MRQGWTGDYEMTVRKRGLNPAFRIEPLNKEQRDILRDALHIGGKNEMQCGHAIRRLYVNPDGSISYCRSCKNIRRDREGIK
jgi:hypothetical protein